MYTDIDACPIGEVDGPLMTTTCDTMEGMSGAALWGYLGGWPCIFATHYAGDWHAQRNEASRFGKGWIQWIRENVICKYPSQYASYGGC